MSQFPADPKSNEADPFDELARLINGDAPASPSSDYDIQAAMEGRVPASAPVMPVFDPSAPAPASGVHNVPTRGPLARVAQRAETEEEAVFDLTALRAAFETTPTAPVEPIPAPVADAALAPEPIFTPPPVAYVPETELAEVVAPPTAFAAPLAQEPEIVAAPSMFDEMQAMMTAAAPVADFELDLESELEAALMSNLATASKASFAPVPEAAAMAAAPIVAEPSMRRQVRPGGARRAMAVAAAVLMLGSGSAVAWSVMSDDEKADIPVVLAKAGPVRVEPTDKGGAVIPNRDTALFQGDRKPHQDALRSGAEKPVEVALAAKPLRPVKVKTQLKRALPPTARKVRTVVVKPDGTIVSGDAIVGSVEPRVIKPVAVAPKIDAPTLAVREVAATPRKVEPQPVVVAKRDIVQPEPVVKAVAKKLVVEKPAPVVAQKRSSDYVVQISSRRSPESARRAFAKLQKRYGSVLGDRSAEYQKTDIAGKGTFYRVRVLSESKSDAKSLCGSLKRAGGSCFVTR